MRNWVKGWMKGQGVERLAVLGIVLAGLSGSLALRPVPRVEPDDPAAVHTTGGATLPLAFEPNVGQSDPRVRFLAHAAAGTLFFTPGAVVLALPNAECGVRNAECGQDGLTLPPAVPRGAAPAAPQILRVQFVDADLAATIRTQAPLAGRVNYLLGPDPAQWHTDLPTYAGIVYTRLYPGVDVQYAGESRQLKSTYILAPQADPARLRWRYQCGVQHTGCGVTIDELGNLQVRLDDGRVLTERAPVAWQEVAGRRIMVPVQYVLSADGTVGFAVGVYDRARPLIIDPTLVYSTYLGGAGNDHGTSIVVDSAGNAYLTGDTASATFPTQNAYQSNYGGGTDAFVTKLNAAGTGLVYSTYLGGGGSDYGRGIAVNGAGEVYVAGATTSGNFPTYNAWQPSNAGGLDAFATILNAAGNGLVYSTYLGGSGTFDYGWNIALDSQGSFQVAGFTNSTTFPLQNPYQGTYGGGLFDAFVTKFSPTGQALVYSTYLGGQERDYTRSFALDAAGNAYVGGQTYSTNFPSTAGVFQPACASNCTYGDAFLAKFTPTGGLLYSTFLGGAIEEVAYGLAVDAAGNAYLTGTTTSLNFPTRNPFQPNFVNFIDAFVTKFNAGATDLVYSTYLGGNSTDYGFAIAVSAAGHAYVTGYANSTNFPILNPVQGTNAGGADAFVTKFAPGGNALVYSTFLGGTVNDFGYGIALDGLGNAYVTGYTASTDFPTQTPYQPANAGGEDVIVFKINDQPEVTATPTQMVTATPPGPTNTPGATSTVTPPLATGTATVTPPATATATRPASPTATVCALQFTDVDPNNPFYGFIRCLACRQIVSGYADGTFRWGNDVTRGQLSKIIANAAGLSNAVPSTQQTFSDVPNTNTFWVFVERLAGIGAISGYACGGPGEPCDPLNRPYFRWGANATRGQISKITAVTAGWNGPIPTTQQTFADVPPSNAFWTWIEELASRQIISGYGCGGPGEPCDPLNRAYFRWGANATRGQMSKIAANTFFPNCQTPVGR